MKTLTQYDIIFRKDLCLGDSDRGTYTTGTFAESPEAAAREIESNWSAYHANVISVTPHSSTVSVTVKDSKL